MDGVEILGPVSETGATILTDEAVAFVVDLIRTFRDRVDERLAAREARRGKPLKFLDETKEIRDGDWTVAPLPDDLLDRRVEITGPVDRKMIINALNSRRELLHGGHRGQRTARPGANCVEGQVNLRDAVRRHHRASTTSAGTSTYALNDEVATLLVRPRGWHLVEKHFLVDGKPAPGRPLRFRPLLLPQLRRRSWRRARGPYFYLPKMESHLEARLWNDVFLRAQEKLGVPSGQHQGHGPDRDAPRRFRDGRDPLRAARAQRPASTVAAGTTSSASSRSTQNDAEAHLSPTAGEVGMTQHVHARLHLAVGHQAPATAAACTRWAAWPRRSRSRADPEPRTRRALEKVRQDKLREVQGRPRRNLGRAPRPRPDRQGASSTSTCPRQEPDREQEARGRPGHRRGPAPPARGHARASPTPRSATTCASASSTSRPGFSGNGCVPLYHLMEDAATAEISPHPGVAVAQARRRRSTMVRP